MKRVKSREARDHMRDLLNDVERGEHVEICRYDTPTAVLVPVDWYRKQVGEEQADAPQT